MSKPLQDQAILVTRPRTTAETPLVDRLHELGASVVLHPVIEISEPEDWEPVDEAVRGIGQFGTVAFLSGSGVQYFFSRFRVHAPADGFGKCKIAAIGNSTAEVIREYGEDVAFVSSVSNSEGMAELLLGDEVPKPILVLRASRGSDVLAKRLEEAGADFKEVIVYKSQDIEKADAKTVKFLDERDIDWVTITSSAIARSAAELFGDSLRKARIASISPTTTAALEEAGFQADVEATEYNFEGLVEAICEAI